MNETLLPLHTISTYVYAVTPSAGNLGRDRRSVPWRPPGSPKSAEGARRERRDRRGKHVGASVSANDQLSPRAVRWGALCCCKKRVKDCEEGELVSLPYVPCLHTPVPRWQGCRGFNNLHARQSQRFTVSEIFYIFLRRVTWLVESDVLYCLNAVECTPHR